MHHITVALVTGTAVLQGQLQRLNAAARRALLHSGKQARAAQSGLQHSQSALGPGVLCWRSEKQPSRPGSPVTDQPEIAQQGVSFR